MMQTHFGQFHPEVEELQRLSDAPVTEQNAENFLVFLDRAFPNNSWEQHDIPKGIVESYLGKLDAIQDAWSDEIGDEIKSSSMARGALASSITPQRTNVVAHPESLSASEYSDIAKRVLRSNIPHRNNREVFYFQTYYNEIHADNSHISVDGVVGTQTLGVVDTHIIATKVFLNELGASLELNETIDDETKAALQEYFGMDFEATVAGRAAEAVQEEYDRIHAMSEADLYAALAEANSRGTEKLSDKRAYISEFVRRYKEAGTSVVPNSSNTYILTDIDGNAISTQHTQEDLQSIMVLLSVNASDIFNEDMLKENIANNIFDYVVQEKGLQKSNGTAWTAGDFEASDLVTQSEVDANKTACSAQIDAEIIKLRDENKKDTTNLSQKQANILMIQKLEIAKIFVLDKTRISDSSLEFARSITDDREEIARALGTTEEDMVRIYGQMEGGDMQSLGKSMIFPLILALIGGVFSRLLPEGFLRTAFQGSILGLLGLKFASEASERGYGITRPGDVSGTNAPVVEGTDLTGSYQEALNAILTDAPAGLEARHKRIYAESVKYNNENQGGIGSRETLDTTFLVLSQDPTFRGQDLSALEDLDASSALNLISPEGQEALSRGGATGEDVKILIRILKAVSTDTQDQKANDLFVRGKESDESNKLNVTWIAGDSFSDQNKEINTQISLLSGMSFGVSDTIRGSSIRADVEEILGKAEPGFTAWITARTLEQAGMDDWNVTHPSISNIDTVITELTTVSTRAGISVSDKAAIDAIIGQYTQIKESLEGTQEVDTYLSEATAVYSITGGAMRFGENVIDWVRGFGSPVATTGNVPATTTEIDAMITRGETLAGQAEYASRKDDILRVVENLRLYRINRLDEIANDSTLSAADQLAARTESNGILKSAVEANLELYVTTLESIRQDTTSLIQTHTNTTGYIAAIAANRENIATLARLKSLGVSANINGTPNTFTADANALYEAIFTNGIVENFTDHVTSQTTALAAIDTSATALDTRAKIQTAETNLSEIQQELVMTGLNIDVLNFFGLTKDDYEYTIGSNTGFNAALAMDELFQKIAGTTTSFITFDPNTLNTKASEIAARRRDVIGDLEDDTITQITVAGSSVPWTSINVSNDDHITALISAIENQEQALAGLDRETLDDQIKEVVAMFVAKIPTGVDQAASNTLEDLKEQYDRFDDAVGTAGDNSFEEAYDEKVIEITLEDILSVDVAAAPNELNEYFIEIATTLGILELDANNQVQYDTNGVPLIVSGMENHPFWKSITEPGKTMKDLIEAVNGAIGAGGPNEQVLTQSRDRIITVLANGRTIRFANWIQDKYQTTENAIITFYNTLTQ